MNTIKEFASSFKANWLLWNEILSFTPFKIFTVSRLSTLLSVLLRGRSGCHIKSLNWGQVSLQAQTFELPSSAGYHLSPPPGPPKKKKNGDPRPSPNYRPHIEKGVFLIGFRKFLPNILPAAYIFSYTIMSYLKKLVGTKSVNTKQCSVALSLRIISHVFPSLPKLSPPLMLLCCPQQAWTFVPFS